jgi:hypothetical protein
MTPVQRSIAYLKAQGFALVQKVEHWNSFAHVRQDLWGGDIIAINLTPPMTLLVQVTDGNGNAEHIRKLQAMSSTDLLKSAGWSLQIHAWRKLKKSRKWEPLITNL